MTNLDEDIAVRVVALIAASLTDTSAGTTDGFINRAAKFESYLKNGKTNDKKNK